MSSDEAFSAPAPMPAPSAASGPFPADDSRPDVATWHLSVAYDGTRYHGWQIQPSAPTVQGELQSRLRYLLRDQSLRISGTSRTDAGVHALDQRVSFTAVVPPGLTPAGMQHTLNRWLPDDIRVVRVLSEAPGFHARHDTAGKAYTYVIWQSSFSNPFVHRFVWNVSFSLDADAMRAAAATFVGVHDFAAFSANPRQPVESTVREIFRVEAVERGPFLFLNVVGRSFLYKMVRTLAGYLVKVGRRQIPPERTPELLAGGSREAVPAETAPAQGLFLARVFETEDEWRAYEPVLPPFDWAALSVGSRTGSGDCGNCAVE